MSNARRLHYPYDEYVRLREQSGVKLEYYDGEIFAMAGGTPEHAALAARLIHLLQLGRAPCRVYSSDLAIRPPTGLTTYPDVSVICGELVRAADDPNAAANPTLLVEVTSASTEDYDRGEKLSHYKQISSLQAVLIVSHSRPRVTVHRREASGFSTREARPGETIELPSPALLLAVDDVFRDLLAS
jgi:Uma2 family endonuclease